MNNHCVYHGSSKTFKRDHIDIFNFSFPFFPIFNYSMYLQNILNHSSCKRRRISYLSLSPFRCLSIYFESLLNEMIINHIFHFLFSAHKIYKTQNETHKHAHTWIKQNSKKKMQNTQKQICPKIYIKYVCMKTQILEEVLQSLLFLFEKLFFSHSLCLCLEVLLFLLVWYWFILACKISPTCFVNENSVLTKL